MQTSSGRTFARTLVTSALPYANGDIHLGHLAGAYLPADIFVRYLRLRGEPVLYICGSFAAFGISFDNFSQTSRESG